MQQQFIWQLSPSVSDILEAMPQQCHCNNHDNSIMHHEGHQGIDVLGPNCLRKFPLNFRLVKAGFACSSKKQNKWSRPMILYTNDGQCGWADAEWEQHSKQEILYLELLPFLRFCHLSSLVSLSWWLQWWRCCGCTVRHCHCSWQWMYYYQGHQQVTTDS